MIIARDIMRILLHKFQKNSAIQIKLKNSFFDSLKGMFPLKICPSMEQFVSRIGHLDATRMCQ